MHHDLLIPIFLIDNMLQKCLNFINMRLGFVHLPKAIADLVLEQFGLWLLVEGSDEGVDGFWFLEGFDAEEGVNSVSNCRVCI